MELTGQQRITVLLLAMGDKFSSDVFKRMDRQEIADVSRAIVELPPVPKDVVEQVLRDFHESLVEGVDMISGGSDILKRLLVKNTDPETAKYIMDTLNLDTGPAPFRELGQVSPRMLSQILRNEHPQTLALIMGHLNSDQAASLLTSLPAGVRAEVLMRLARLESVPEDMLMEVDKVLTSQLIAMGGKEGKKVGGVQSVAEILNAVDRATEEEVLSEIEEDSAQMAEDIRNLMFVFEDCKNIDDKGIRAVILETQQEDLILALRGASDELKEKFFRNMSERAANMIREELEYMGPTKLSDVEGAQQNIVKVVRRLEAENKVVVNRGGNSDIFV